MSHHTPAWHASSVALLRSAGLPATWLTGLAYEPLRHAYDDLATSELQLYDLRRKVVAAMRAHGRRKTVKFRPLGDDVASLCPDDLVEAWNRALEARDTGSQRFDQAWDLALGHEDSQLLQHLRDETVQECLLLMSPGAYRGLTAQADSGTLRTTARRVAYRYLQRFCGKAETIGPSGPLNLLLLRDGEPAPGAHQPGVQTASFVDRCVGEVRYATTGDGSAAVRRTLLTFWAAYALIDALGREVHIPGHAGDAGPYVRNVTDQLDSQSATEVRHLVDDVERFATLRQADRPAELDRLAVTFEQITGRSAWRGHGEFYADRMILVEEAFDNVLDAHVVDDGSGRLADRLGTALDLLASIAVEHRLRGQRGLRELMRQRGTASLPALDVRDFDLEAAPAVGAMPVEFNDLVDTAEPVVSFTRAELEAAGLIRSDLPAWPLFAAADVMLLGPDRPADTTQLVLSEVHHIWPNLSHPSRELMGDDRLGVAEVARQLGDLVAPARPLVQQLRRTQRGTDTSAAGQDLLCLEEMERGDFADAIGAGELVVREWANGFVGLSSPGRDRDYWLLPEYDDAGMTVGGLVHCAAPALDLPKFTLGTHTPRIVVDGVVLQRRRWDPPLSTVPRLGNGARGRDWGDVRQWQAQQDLPRFVFFITDVEPKPMWLDFESPVSVANFSQAMSKATRVALTEMLPHPDQLWLTTQSGMHVSEIRILFTRQRHERSVLKDAE